MGKSISKSLNSKYSKKNFDHPKQFATDVFKTSSTSDLIGNKIADKITRTSKTSPKNKLETSAEEILREKYISPQLREKNINDLRLEEENSR